MTAENKYVNARSWLAVNPLGLNELSLIQDRVCITSACCGLAERAAVSGEGMIRISGRAWPELGGGPYFKQDLLFTCAGQISYISDR